MQKRFDKIFGCMCILGLWLAVLSVFVVVQACIDVRTSQQIQKLQQKVDLYEKFPRTIDMKLYPQTPSIYLTLKPGLPAMRLEPEK